jgi:PAS domain S-box-containing protein
MPSFALISALIGYGIWKHKLFSLTPAAATDSIINTMSDSLFLVGMDKKIKLINKAAHELTEYEAGEILGQPIDLLFSRNEDETNTLFKHGTGFRGLIKTVIKGDVEAIFMSKSGRRIPVSLSGSLIRDTENDLLGIVCIARDISERQKQREHLRMSEEKYRLLVENAPLGIITIDTKGNIVDVNPKLIEMLGSPSTEATREINMFTFPPLVESGVSDDVRRCLTEQCQIVEEHPYTSKWGKNLYLRYYLVTRCDNRGAIVGAQGIVEDITSARKAAEALQKAKNELETRVLERTAELSEANAKLTQIANERLETQRLLANEKEQLDVTLRSIADGVIAADVNGNIVLMNKAAEAITGFSAAEAIGNPLASVCRTFGLDGAISEDIAAIAIKSGGTIERPLPVILKSRDGAERIISHNAAPIRDKAGIVTGVVLAFADITEKHKLESELFRTRKFESIGALAGGIAHDFNNILTGIITNLFVAKMQIDKTSEAFSLIADSEKAAFKASGLTNQLLAFSKQNQAVRTVVSMKDMLEDSVGFFLSGSSADYTLESAEDLWSVEIDRGQIDRVIHTLVRNAAKRMPGGGTVSISVENTETDNSSPSPLRFGKYVRITVTDEGGHVSQQEIDGYFEPYVNHSGDDAGLEMAAAYAIIQKHNGHVRVSSNDNNGVSIAVYLPAVVENEDSENPAPVQADPEQTLNSPRKKILIMDDEELVRNAGKKLITLMGYDVETCSDGNEALRLYESAIADLCPFDAVILDLTIPGGMGGKETMAKLLDVDPDVKGILSSGYSPDDILETSRESGFMDCIAKPYSMDDLKQTLLAVIEGDDAERN